MTRPRIRTLAALAAATALLAACATAPDPRAARSTSPAVAVGSWEWRGTATPAGEYQPTVARTYQLRLRSDGVAHIESDCNFARARYEISEGRIKFGPLSTSRQGCTPPSLGDVFISDVTRSDAFYVQSGYLYLDLPRDSGQMRFVPAPFWPPYDWTW
jgi:heat shock protein HslJ